MRRQSIVSPLRWRAVQIAQSALRGVVACTTRGSPARSLIVGPSSSRASAANERLRPAVVSSG